MARGMSPAAVEKRWRGSDTTPSEIAHALSELLNEIHRDNPQYVPARVINLVCVVDEERSRDIMKRLRGVGRYHGSRTIVCSVTPDRKTLDATATITTQNEPKNGELGLLRETIVVQCGVDHLENLDSIVDPLLVTDLATCVWSPHGHREAVDSLLDLSQVVLTDSSEEVDVHAAITRNRELAKRAYIVDLAWLRTTPWRERLATTFDPPRIREELANLCDVTIRHAPESQIAALLLAGWLASRLDWRVAPLALSDGSLTGTAKAASHRVSIRLELDEKLDVPGLAGLELRTNAGRVYGLERGDGGLRASYRNRRGDERRWTILGASRGEPGILGEGIRQALLREQTYGPALHRAEIMLPKVSA